MAKAQSPNKSKIIDAFDSSAIAYATIEAICNQQKIFTFTDINGFFLFNNLINCDTVNLEIRAVGYQPKVVKISLIALKSKTNYFSLTLNDSLPEVVVKAKTPISTNGDTTRFETGAFTNGYENNIGELIAKMPGFDVKPSGLITYNKKPIQHLLIDMDDLAGKSYGALTQTFPPKAVETVEVIQNYKDEEDIFENTGMGNVLVVNLKIKEAFKKQIFGNIEASTAAAAHLRIQGEAKLNYISKNIKLVSTAMYNNNGKVNNNGNRDNISNTVDKFGELYNIGNTISPQILHQSVPAYTQNHSSKLPLFFLQRFSAKLKANVRLPFQSDNFEQNEDKLLLIKQLNFVDTQTSSLHSRFVQHGATPEIKLQYNANEKLQINGQIKTGSFYNNANQTGTLQQERQFNSSKVKDNFYEAKVGLSALLPNRSAIRLSAYHKQQKQFSDFYTDNQKLVNFFFDNNNDLSTTNKQRTNFKESGIILDYKKKFKKININTSLNYSTEFTHFENNLILLNSMQQKLAQSSKDTVPDSKISRNFISAKLSESFRYGKLEITLNQELTSIYSKVTNLHNYSQITNNNLYFLPSANFVFKLNKNSQFQLNSSISNKLEPANTLIPGYRIRNFTSVNQGSFAFTNTLAKSVGVYFSSFTNKHNGTMLLAGITYNNMPLQYLGYQINSPALFLQQYSSSKLSTNMLMGNITYAKRFSSSSKLNISAHYLFQDNYVVISNLTNNTNMHNTNLEISWVQHFNHFKIQSKLSSMYFFQKMEIMENMSTNSTYSGELNLSYEVNKQSFVSVNYEPIYFYRNTKSVSNIHLLSCYAEWQMKNNKIRYFIKGNNFLNTKTMGQLSQSNVFYSSTQISIFSVGVAAGIKFNFGTRY
ncbi:peptidase associated/transthyretin-like domain-containing protein [Polluticaenibacter yanchengensis]|uniref:TonB-dependent receptor n=1 Tax=Polluticaenibacter yanchengensis TaxID=3014562 RepID=A0ABT4UN98_9BACT|nr:hypothetical protein [Chitinophagaceae bacterium LY-5]